MSQNGKKQFLDPISTISKIILLHFSHSNTKLRIIDHTVQLVDNTMVESITRRWYGDSRNDMCALYPIFVRFVELYIIEKQKNTNFDNCECYESLKKIGQYAIVGLKELQKTYGYDNAVFTLQFYINLIESGIDKKYTEKILPVNLRELTKNNLIDDSKIQKIWEDSHIIELGKTFENCFNAEKTNDKILLSGNIKKIMDILEMHDKEFKKLIGPDIE
ncbi:hypothetical protein BMW23_0318 [Bodo saltans virus]|uniref:Uncharacterized protein n=1 Tax=Bodo saltans virus TaxID=2024608 RepID=A0A2H4UU37_9VIRU|nr:hypothetical protein QJ851_gp0313 [Bodo saltans virus]ATZ80376.1 hypothetical protein BMW23_0318 [Bodo saltans virus]